VTSALTEQAFGQHVQAVFAVLDDIGEASSSSVGEATLMCAGSRHQRPYNASRIQQALFEYSEV